MTRRGHLSALSADSMSAYAGRESSDSPRSGRTLSVYRGCPLSAPLFSRLCGARRGHLSAIEKGGHGQSPRRHTRAPRSPDVMRV
jgi:hypothetical protein